jgi:hypothetical protein
VVDKKTRGEYRAAYQGISTGIRNASQTMQEDLFPIRELLINLLTEPHIDRKDWRVGGLGCRHSVNMKVF